MQASLVFAPASSPAYMPLGIAALAEYMGIYCPSCQLSTHDLNIKLWDNLSDQKPEFIRFKDFFRGKEGNFFDKAQYLYHLESWFEISRQIDKYSDACKNYLQTDQMTESLAEILHDQCNSILIEAPKIIGISVMYPEQIIPSLAIAKHIWEIKGTEKPDIILGGATASIMDADEILHCCEFVDAILQGEGEEGLRMLCEEYAYNNIPGLRYRSHGNILKNTKPDTISLAKVPLPTFACLDTSLYFNSSPVVPVIFSRGCKWRKCRFCAHNFSYSGYRKHQISKFVDYLEYMDNSMGARHFYFADQYVDADDMVALSREILNRNLDIAFHIMGRPTDDYTPEILDTMSQAGCRWISWGVESGSQRLIDICNKGTSVDTIKKVLEDTYNANISNLPMMIYGLPTSNDIDLEQTFDMIDDVLDYCDDFTASSFKLFDQTPFASQAAKYDIKITEQEVIFTRKGVDVHSMRLIFKEKAADCTYRTPRGPYEADKWRRRKKMMGLNSVFTDLCCEHYLLYANQMHSIINNKPRKRPAVS
ncbi:MAG: radical SAM protein [Sedimentisphaeraceae bacterium JB056]